MIENRSPMEISLGLLIVVGVLTVLGFSLYDRANPLANVPVDHVAGAEELIPQSVAQDEDASRKRGPIGREHAKPELKQTALEQTVYELKTGESEYLWDLEHHNNVLTKYGFQGLIRAWTDSDRDSILAVFDNGFQGRLIEPEAAQTLAMKTDLVNVSRRVATPRAALEADRDAVVDWLLELRSQFASDPPPRGRFDVRTISPPDENPQSLASDKSEDDSRSDSWTVNCIHRLWGQSQSGGALEYTIHMTIQTDDLSKERLARPGWLRGCELTQVSSAHSGEPLFRDVTRESNIDVACMHDNWVENKKVINTGGVYACDFDHDGYTDLLVTDEYSNRFYFGGPDGKFLEATRKIGLDDASELDRAKRSVTAEMTAAFADLDNDGWEDLILPISGRVYRNENGKRLLDVTHKSNLGQLLHRMSPRSIVGIAIADYNRDGLVDLYAARWLPPVGSWLESRQPKMVANQLIRNEGDWTFKDVTSQTDTGGGGRSCFTAAWTDVNHDLWPDLYIINEFGDGALFVNRDGKSFQQRPLVESQRDFGSMGLSCGDINNDGNIDIYVSNMYSKAGSRIMGNMIAEDYPEEVKQKLRNMVGGGEMYLNQGDLSFKTVGKDYQVHAAGWAWGSSLADFDNDGWLDLYVTAGFMSRDRKKPDG